MKRCARYLLPGLFSLMIAPAASLAEPVALATVQSEAPGLAFPDERVEDAPVMKGVVPGTGVRGGVRPSGRAPSVGAEDVLPEWRHRFWADAVSLARQWDGQAIRASLRLLSKVHERRMRLVAHRFADVDGDGALEAAVISEYRQGGEVLRILSVYAFDEQARPKLRYEKKQAIGASGQYVQTLEPRDQGFGYCEDWEIASWLLHECHDIVFDRSWQPWVSRHEIRTTDPQASSMQRNVFDFRHRRASRSYKRLPEGPYMPPLSRHAGYDMILAPHDAGLSQAASLRVSQETASGAHPPVAYAVSWNRKGVFYAFEFRDEDIRESGGCSDQLSVQKVDHAEFWFDLDASLEIRRDSPQSWLLEYEKNYHSEPYRHSLDESVFGISVTPDGCVVPMNPARDYWTVQPQVTVSRLGGGYRVDMFMPAEFFGVSDMNQLDRSIGLSFTALQHDVHGEVSWDTVSTSDWQWPDPFTFSQIWLLPHDGPAMPPFPLQWRAWLVDN